MSFSSEPNWINSPNGWIIVLIAMLFGFWIGVVYIQREQQNTIDQINKMTQSPMI